MAHKSGISHGLESIIMLIVGSIIVKYLRPTFSRIIGGLETIAELTSRLIGTLFPIDVNPDIFLPMAIVFVLCFTWGVSSIASPSSGGGNSQGNRYG